MPTVLAGLAIAELPDFMCAGQVREGRLYSRRAGVCTAELALQSGILFVET